jgi:hypothetical protein
MMARSWSRVIIGRPNRKARRIGGPAPGETRFEAGRGRLYGWRLGPRIDLFPQINRGRFLACQCRDPKNPTIAETSIPTQCHAQRLQPSVT